MATITAPDFTLRNIEWSLDRPAQINRAMTGVRTAPAEPWYGKRFARVELATIHDEDDYRLLRSFFVRCQGQVNSFKLYAVVENQNSNSGVTVGSTAAAGAVSMTLSGTTTALTEGQMVTVNDQLLTLTEDQSGSTITFEPPLREQASSGTSVETSRPWALVKLAAPQAGWGVDAPGQFNAAFEVEEAF